MLVRRSTIAWPPLLAAPLAASLLAGLTGCQSSPAGCDTSGCELRLAPGERHRMTDHADVLVSSVTVRNEAADTAVVTVNGEQREILSGSTSEVAGFRITVVTVEHRSVHVLVTPADS